jgi:hypothetical protein
MQKPNAKTLTLALAFVLPMLALVALPDKPGSAAGVAPANKTRTAQVSKQKNTMGDMKLFATGLEAYHTDNKHYPEGASIAQAMKALVPVYLSPAAEKALSRDRWGHEYHYLAWQENPKAAGPDHYMLVSAGQDGKFDHENLRDYKQTKDNQLFDADIAIGDGQFTQQPVGKQK